MLSVEQIKTVDAALYAADAEFIEQYAIQFGYAKKEKDCPNYIGASWCIEILNKCHQFGRKAIRMLQDGMNNEALNEIKNAVAAEGDFCGWKDFRVYNTPYKILQEMLIQ